MEVGAKIQEFAKIFGIMSIMVEIFYRVDGSIWQNLEQKIKYLMPCPFTGPKMFCDSKNLARHKTFWDQ